MGKEKIKADWASVRITPDQAVVVFTRSKDIARSLYFANIDAFLKSIADKDLSIRKWVLSIPDEVCITKTLDLPAQSLEEAAQMVEFELLSLVPIPADNTVYGCTAVKQEDNIFEVRVCIVRSDILDKLLEPYRQIGINPDKVVSASTALFASLPISETKSEICIFLDESKCHLITTLNGNIRSSQCLPISDVRSNATMRELANSIVHREQELKTFTETIHINLITSIENPEEIVTVLNDSELHFPVSVINRSTVLPDNKAVPFLEGVMAAGAYHTISDQRYDHLNLLPASHLNMLKKRRKIKTVAFTAILTIVAIMLLWSNIFIRNWRTSRACQKVQQLIAPIEQIATDVEQKKQLLRALQNQLSTGREITAIFDELYRFSPESVSICDLKYKQKNAKRLLSMTGQTDSLPQAFDYSEAMKKSLLLKQIQITNVQQTPTPGGSIVEFKAECQLQEQL